MRLASCRVGNGVVFMEVQDTKDSRRELQAIQEAIGQQNLVMQRLERNLRRLEDSYSKVTSRLEAIESVRIAPDPPDKAASVERGRPGHLMSSSGHKKEAPREPSDGPASGPGPTPGPLSEDSGKAPAGHAGSDNADSGSTPASHLKLLVRAKSALRGAILDGSVNATLDRVQSSLSFADEAAGALSQISAMVKASLEGSTGIQEFGITPIPGGSLALLLDLAKTPQFQKFIAGIVSQFLKDSGQDQLSSSGNSSS